MDTEIILAGLADVERLLPHCEVFWKFERLPFEAARVRRVLSELLTKPSFGRVFIAQRGADVLGYLVLTFGYSIEHGGRDALVDELYVREGTRGSGLGTQLLQEAFRACRELGLSRVHLEIDNTNPRAEALYTRLGFLGNDRRLLTHKLD